MRASSSFKPKPPNKEEIIVYIYVILCLANVINKIIIIWNHLSLHACKSEAKEKFVQLLGASPLFGGSGFTGSVWGGNENLFSGHNKIKNWLELSDTIAVSAAHELLFSVMGGFYLDQEHLPNWSHCLLKGTLKLYESLSEVATKLCCYGKLTVATAIRRFGCGV